MSTITFQHVDFAYPSAPVEVFRDLSLAIDTGWRTGVVGRNGQGKTTLLKLAARVLQPTSGHVEVPVPVRLFPSAAPAPGRTTGDVVRDEVAPFSRWEREMEGLLADGGEQALARHADLHERYLALGGYEMQARIAREFETMGLSPELMDRPFEALSGGEQTRALIVALFLDAGNFPLMDEPTNHLDLEGRRQLGDYLSRRSGFLLVSHDRRLLDTATDHILSINRSDVRVNAGNFTRWRTHMDEELLAEQRRRQRIERDVARLETAARSTRQNAESRERDKYRPGALDKGFIGRRAAKQMQRARNVERRIEAELGEKKGLLKNAEKQRRLKVETNERRSDQLLRVQNLTLSVGERVLFRNLSFTVAPGDRIAVVGPNGCGKTTLLNVLDGSTEVEQGLVRRAPGIELSRSHQQPRWRDGALRDRLREAGLDETRFRQLLGVLGVGADVVDQDLASFSQGELKKVDLARSLLCGADVLLWDEPLNYVDVHSREQIEASILEHRPTLVFVEHDAAFIDRVATAVVRLGHMAKRRPIGQNTGSETSLRMTRIGSGSKEREE